MSSLTTRKQDIGFGQNPFIEIKTNPFIESSNQKQTKEKNPFLNDNKSLNINRSVSCDNLCLTMPVIPPLIDFSAKLPQNSFPNQNNQYLLNRDFKGNPFDILKFYRRNFYSVPTHKIGRHLSESFEVNNISEHISLPPTTLFPEHRDLSEVSFLRTNSQNNINTNPFLRVDRHLITSSFSIDSMIGIDSCDENSDESSDNTITQYNTLLNTKIDPIIENDINKDIISNAINDKNNRIYFKKNKNSSKKMTKIFSNKISFKQNKKTDKNVNITKNNYMNRCNVENAKNGYGMEMHDSIINTTSGISLIQRESNFSFFS